MKKKLAVLGATGSIGQSTLEILRNEKERFQGVLFSANTNSGELIKLKKEFPGALTALANDELPAASGIDFSGTEGLLNAIKSAGADITVNGISGAAGLLPSIAVLQAGSDLALANKETLVMAGEIIQSLAKEKKCRIIPVDSEHSAIFQLIMAHGMDNVSEIILTASGGPFRHYSEEKLIKVKPQEALAHPTWKMGRKITIDSATLANKGLEVIEAAMLFGFSPEKIKVVIHPQSIIHSMIRLKNGAVYAQMSKPDMKLPIHDALSWPDTYPSSYGTLDFDSLSLSFEKADTERFPMLALAYKALEAGGLNPVVYNAANEAAVDAFLKGMIGFLEISSLVGYLVCRSIKEKEETVTIESVLERDRETRQQALELIRMGSWKC